MSDNSLIKKIKENEWKVQSNHIILLENNLLYITAVGFQSSELANTIKDLYDIIAKMVNGKINYLIDLNNCGKHSIEARKTWKELSEKEKVRKTAVFGIHPVARVLASFVFKISNNDEMKFFSTEEEAMNWLNT